MKENEIVINKSRFIAYKVNLENLDQVKEIISQLKKEHKKANHVCYAYVFKGDVISEKCSDDGEPGGTAGYPILNVIKKKNLTNTLVAVVRYFGGIKLGAGGLTRAYTKATAEVLKDYRSMELLDWFIKEQGEEETSAQELISKMELFGEDSSGLYLLDKECGERGYSAPDYDFG